MSTNSWCNLLLVYFKKIFIFYSSYWFVLCYVWKMPSSAVINYFIAKHGEHSVSIVNICESLFSLKLFNKSLQRTKNNFRSVAEKE